MSFGQYQKIPRQLCRIIIEGSADSVMVDLVAERFDTRLRHGEQDEKGHGCHADCPQLQYGGLASSRHFDRPYSWLSPVKKYGQLGTNPSDGNSLYPIKS
jgi:hypothetical protein